MENRVTMAPIKHRLCLLGLLVGFTPSILADPGFYITGKKLYYNHESGTPIARKTNRPYQGYSNILFERQQKATDHVSKGEGKQGGIGYTFTTPYHIELSYFGYGKTFKQAIALPATKETVESAFSHISDHDTILTDPHQHYRFAHTTRGLMFVGQRNLPQLHPRITPYVGGGIACLGQYSQDNENPNDALAPPSLWSLAPPKNSMSNHTAQDELKGSPIRELATQEQTAWETSSGKHQHEPNDTRIEETPSSTIQPSLEKWSLSLVAKGGVLIHITNHFTIDISYSILFKKYHLLNIDTAGTCHRVQSTLDADTLNFFKIGVNYKI